MVTIQRDCRVLESFRIMDYSLLVGIHNLDLAAKDNVSSRTRSLTTLCAANSKKFATGYFDFM